MKNPHTFYKLALKCMILSDCGHEKELLPILKDIFIRATPSDKLPKMIVSLVDEFLF
jgi:hypothetical protein